MSEIVEQMTRAEYNGPYCPGVDTSPLWFALYTTPRHEKHVSEMLAQRRIETFLPLYRTTRRWKKSRPVDLELPLFPTYVFVHIAREARGAVLGMPGVISIVGSSKDPWPLPDPEIDALRLGMQAHRVEPHPYLRIGERVRVKSGVMAGVEGILTRKKNEFRMILAFDAIMRSVSIEVDADDIEPVAAFGSDYARHCDRSGIRGVGTDSYNRERCHG
ncbi:MAG: UpxY family transcription antiterminator [Terracidiphilus sp.]